MVHVSCMFGDPELDTASRQGVSPEHFLVIEVDFQQEETLWQVYFLLLDHRAEPRENVLQTPAHFPNPSSTMEGQRVQRRDCVLRLEPLWALWTRGCSAQPVLRAQLLSSVSRYLSPAESRTRGINTTAAAKGQHHVPLSGPSTAGSSQSGQVPKSPPAPAAPNPAPMGGGTAPCSPNQATAVTVPLLPAGEHVPPEVTGPSGVGGQGCSAQFNPPAPCRGHGRPGHQLLSLSHPARPGPAPFPFVGY